MAFGRALRRLTRAPLWTAAVVLTTSLGIGVNVTMFAAADALVFQSPPGLSRPETLARVLFASADSLADHPLSLVSNAPTVEALRQRVPLFAHVAGYTRQLVPVAVDRNVRDEQTEFVTDSYFAVAGIRPVVGRLPTPADEVPVAIISERFWRGRLGSTTPLGRPVVVGGRELRIAAVLPAEFGGFELAATSIWVPIRDAPPGVVPPDWRSSWLSAWLNVVARLPEGATRETASAQASRVLVDLSRDTGLPDGFAPARAVVSSLAEVRRLDQPALSRIAVLLWGVSAAVCLVACASATNLLLARSLARRCEHAIRLALGASRGDLLRDSVAESVLLLTASGICAAVGAVSAQALLRSSLPVDVASAVTGPDARTIAYLCAVCAALAAAVTLVLHTGAPLAGPAAILRQVGVRRTTPLRHSRRAILVGQAAITALLLATAGVLIRSLRNVRAIDVGFDPHHVLAVTLGPEADVLPARARAKALEAAAAAAQAVPGVMRTAIIAKSVPLLAAVGISVSPVGMPPPPRRPGTGPYYTAITEDFLGTLGMRVVAGQAISAADFASRSRVMLVTTTMARRYWGGAANALGQCAHLGDDAECTRVVGVVDDLLKFRLIGEQSAAFLFVPMTHPFADQAPPEAVLVRTRGEALPVVAATERAVRRAATADALPRVISYAALLAPQTRPWEAGAHVLGAFALLALVIAGIGTYSVMNYMVTSRTRELALRVALGAHGRHVFLLVLREAAILGAAGLGIGLGTLFAARDSLRAVLYKVSPTDPLVLLAVSAALFAVVLTGCLAPARRSAQVPPAVLLRDL